MITFLVGFWLGVVLTAAGVYFGTHRDERVLLLSRVKGWIGK